MSMLAEPRRKQKWSVDPRNSAWSNDNSKIGQKLMERMGWSKGKGLGKSEQGATDHIKVKIKNNHHGLGASASQEDNWIAHQDDFNDLLAELNSCHGQSNSTETFPKEQKGFSLEEKSKTSKKRVHYMKFAKGKDLSSRSVTDLNCVFGKRAKSAKHPEQGSSSRDSQSDNGEAPPCEPDPKAITRTVTSTLTMQEYFAQRMAQLKVARNQDAAASSVEDQPCEDASASSEEPKKKMKKKKKSAEEMEVYCDAPVAEEAADEDQQPSKQKKRKRKNEELEGALNENSSTAVEQDCEEEERPPPKKNNKKKHKKHKKEGEMLNGPALNVAKCSEVLEVTEKKCKKHKKKKQDL
ncbi:PIN2/TERF1-interacting telomerase inhibitor 1 [Dunckerocampus dactyliophorus]|uniref:PIN2/TERF1-interacting telomerase inhibitor 1 n=1 Tax=Dunckerocampus dactyliophorus TaxID=161453 RepID=UPI002404A273|nr:PIN2/TERF1-interacting telomerase inhibitor 1 [Dunckerocampus dactyliophorus]